MAFRWPGGRGGGPFAVGVVALLAGHSAGDGRPIQPPGAPRLGGVKAPKTVEFRDEIPNTPDNRMDNKAIRARFWADAERMVH